MVDLICFAFLAVRLSPYKLNEILFDLCLAYTGIHFETSPHFRMNHACPINELRTSISESVTETSP